VSQEETGGRNYEFTIRYDTRVNVDSKADECDQLNLAHETNTNNKRQGAHLVQSGRNQKTMEEKDLCKR